MIIVEEYNSMSMNRITSETSIKDRPMLRIGLMVIWLVIASYTLIVLGAVFIPKVSGLFNLSLAQAIVGIPALLQLGFDVSVDVLIFIGFALIGCFLLVRRSDDWFAIFTSLFLITFGARVTSLLNTLALTPGYEIAAGVVLALGDMLPRRGIAIDEVVGRLSEIGRRQGHAHGFIG